MLLKALTLGRAPRFAVSDWPQFHKTPLNDYWFGENYTDWELVCNNLRQQGGRSARGQQLMRPAPLGADGFGYYNLMDREVRRRQALLAREYGIHGFAIYHYHFGPQFYEAGYDSSGADMDETVLQLLDAHDGEPNLPFYFVWANQAFVWRWTQWNSGRIGKLRPGSVQVMQSYPRSGWRSHYEYLRRFFRHPNYHTVGGKPVFGIFNGNYSGAPMAPPDMLEQYRLWAVEDGFPGIHFLQVLHHGDDPSAQWADGFQDFGWQSVKFVNASNSEHSQNPFGDINPQLMARSNYQLGAIVEFDNTARMGKSATTTRHKGPAGFGSMMDYAVAKALEHGRAFGHREEMLLVPAWNEWSEQSVLEPSGEHGVGYLEELRRVLMRHGQYRYTGEAGAWRQINASDTSTSVPAQLSACATPA